ncbi:hypothetical protein [Streptomyces spiramyceticus]|uniref:hypothetical protein n=1 Tax=Streptomyces spiramyceticus TaxID=299717 RepID=UPI00237B7D64|nr:hypothetical protein [Streptomyces spiramyceticus]
MCNPRRIRVRATRELAVAWEQEMRRRVVRSGEATGEARVCESLRGSVGAPTLAALPGVFARSPGWEETEDAFRFSFDGGYVAYRPAEAELEIVATVSAAIEAVGEATETVRGEVTGTIEAEGTGMYYDDSWGGRNRTSARHDAQAAAEAALNREAEERVRRARSEAGAGAGGEAQEAAAARADAALAAAARAREPELREQAAARLAAVGVMGRNLFHQALADAYRDAVLAYARSRGAEFIRCSETDGVLEIDFELQI